MVAHGLFSIFSTTPDRSFSDVIKYNLSKIGLDRFEFFKKFRLGLANIYLRKLYYFEFAYISIHYKLLLLIHGKSTSIIKSIDHPKMKSDKKSCLHGIMVRSLY